MHIVHGTWLPGAENQFENRGAFLLWVEGEAIIKGRASTASHPFHLPASQLSAFFSETLPLPKAAADRLPQTTTPAWITLPSADGAPLPSPALAQRQGMDLPERFAWRPWRIAALALAAPLPLLKELNFQAQHHADAVRLGQDLLFWLRFGRALGEILRRHHYIPAVLPYAPNPPRGRGKHAAALAFTTGWQPLSARFEALVRDFGAAMPGLCRALSSDKPKASRTNSIALREPAALLRHFAAQQLTQWIEQTPFTQKICKSVAGTFIAQTLATPGDSDSQATLTEETWQQWQRWRQRLEQVHQGEGFVLCFRLQEASEQQPDAWTLQWLALPFTHKILLDF